jgi:hypothetical protein
MKTTIATKNGALIIVWSQELFIYFMKTKTNWQR